MARPQGVDGGTANIYRISSRGQLTRVDPPSWGLGELLTTPCLKNWLCYDTLTRASDLDWHFGRPKMDLKEVRGEGMDWIDLAEDRDRWRALVNAVMNLRVP